MVKNTFLFAILCILIRCQNAMIDWPTTVSNSSDASGFLKKFQISSDNPTDGQTFTVQAIYYLKKSIEWQGVSDRNLFYMYSRTSQGKSRNLDIKNKKQFAQNAGVYKAGENITLGFSYTFNSSQNASDGAIAVWLGNQDFKKYQFIDVFFKMPVNDKSNQEKIETQTHVDKLQ